MNFFSGQSGETGYDIVGAVLIYNRESYYGDDTHVICTYNRISGGKILPGEPLDLEQVVRIAKMQDQQTEMPTILPRNLISYSADRMCWWRKSHKGQIFFKCKNLGELNGKEIIWPDLLFLAERGGSMKVFVITEHDFSEKTKLFCAPFYNIFSGGKLCLPSGGNVGIGIDNIPANEALFFDSFFSHPNCEDLTFCPGGIDGLMKRLAKGESIKREWLKGYKTLGEVLRGN